MVTCLHVEQIFEETADMPPLTPLTRQQKKIIEAGTSIAADRPTDQDKAFLSRQLVQTTLPHSDPGDVPVWSRQNGNLTLTIQQGYAGDGKPFGHPFGTIPRLIMYWMTTEALRLPKGELRLKLGDSLAHFLDEVGLDASRGGKRSDAHRLKEQMTRLLEARITFRGTLEREDGEVGGTRTKWINIADEQSLWWDAGRPKQRALWGSYVDLTARFHEAITANPIPVDLRALRAIKRSPLALDLYSLLTYQAFRAGKGGRARYMTWRQLQASLGTSYADTANLRKAIKPALTKIQAVYPDLAIGERDGGIEVLPESLPAIAPR
jgi:hypothetical protein